MDEKRREDAQVTLVLQFARRLFDSLDSKSPFRAPLKKKCNKWFPETDSFTCGSLIAPNPQKLPKDEEEWALRSHEDTPAPFDDLNSDIDALDNSVRGRPSSSLPLLPFPLFLLFPFLS